MRSQSTIDQARTLGHREQCRPSNIYIYIRLQRARLMIFGRRMLRAMVYVKQLCIMHYFIHIAYAQTRYAIAQADTNYYHMVRSFFVSRAPSRGYQMAIRGFIDVWLIMYVERLSTTLYSIAHMWSTFSVPTLYIYTPHRTYSHHCICL